MDLEFFPFDEGRDGGSVAVIAVVSALVAVVLIALGFWLL